MTTDGASPALDARELYRFYHAGDDETFALRGVSLSLVPSQVVAIVGPSGSGKSTLVACLAGLDEPDGGHVVVAGERLTRRSEAVRAALRARWIGVLLQSANLIEHLSVAENVRVARRLAGASRNGRVEELLGFVGLASRSNARPSTLSGGEAARAGLAVALANDPAVVIADEPTAEVDAASERTILTLLREGAARGAAVLLFTHSERVAAAADRVLTLRDGRLEDA